MYDNDSFSHSFSGHIYKKFSGHSNTNNFTDTTTTATATTTTTITSTSAITKTTNTATTVDNNLRAKSVVNLSSPITKAQETLLA